MLSSSTPFSSTEVLWVKELIHLHHPFFSALMFNWSWSASGWPLTKSRPTFIKSFTIFLQHLELVLPFPQELSSPWSFFSFLHLILHWHCCSPPFHNTIPLDLGARLWGIMYWATMASNNLKTNKLYQKAVLGAPHQFQLLTSSPSSPARLQLRSGISW